MRSKMITVKDQIKPEFNLEYKTHMTEDGTFIEFISGSTFSKDFNRLKTGEPYDFATSNWHHFTIEIEKIKNNRMYQSPSFYLDLDDAKRLRDCLNLFIAGKEAATASASIKDTLEKAKPPFGVYGVRTDDDKITPPL